jgi:hypothetical protein
MLCLSYYAYVFSSTKLEISAEQFLPGSEVPLVSSKQILKMYHPYSKPPKKEFFLKYCLSGGV